MLLLVLGAGAAACGSPESDPPRSPLADTSTPRPSTPTATRTPTPSASASATATIAPTQPPAGTPTAAELENAVGLAIELMAEFLGVDAVDLSVAEAEIVVWPDSCIGVERPGSACAEVETPGFRIQLHDRFDAAHTLHADVRGQFVWAGEVQVLATIVELDLATGRAVVEFDDGPSELAIVPGTLIEDATLRAGGSGLDIPVVVGVDPTADPSVRSILAWIERFEGP